MSINLIVVILCCIIFSAVITFNHTKRLISRVVLVLSLLMIMEVAEVAHHSHVKEFKERQQPAKLAWALKN